MNFKFNFSNLTTNAKSLVSALFDSTLSTSVTYKKLSSNTYDPATGKNTQTFDEYSIDMVRSDTALEAQGSSTVLSAIGFQAGKMFYYVKYSDLNSIRSPRSSEILKDYIVDGGEEYLIKKAVPVFDVLVKIQV